MKTKYVLLILAVASLFSFTVASKALRKEHKAERATTVHKASLNSGLSMEDSGQFN